MPRSNSLPLHLLINQQPLNNSQCHRNKAKKNNKLARTTQRNLRRERKLVSRKGWLIVTWTRHCRHFILKFLIFELDILSLFFKLLNICAQLHARAATIYNEWTSASEDGALHSHQQHSREGSGSTTELWTAYWRPLLQAMARMSCDCRRRIRAQALDTLGVSTSTRGCELGEEYNFINFLINWIP